MELPEGLHFRYEHCRNFSKPNGYGFDPTIISPLGGVTLAYLENDKNEILETGAAYCSETEQYVKKIGRDISSGRALKAYYESVRV